MISKERGLARCGSFRRTGVIFLSRQCPSFPPDKNRGCEKYNRDDDCYHYLKEEAHRIFSSRRDSAATVFDASVTPYLNRDHGRDNAPGAHGNDRSVTPCHHGQQFYAILESVPPLVVAAKASGGRIVI